MKILLKHKKNNASSSPALLLFCVLLVALVDNLGLALEYHLVLSALNSAG